MQKHYSQKGNALAILGIEEHCSMLSSRAHVKEIHQLHPQQESRVHFYISLLVSGNNYATTYSVVSTQQYTKSVG